MPVNMERRLEILKKAGWEVISHVNHEMVLKNGDKIIELGSKIRMNLGESRVHEFGITEYRSILRLKAMVRSGVTK
jgi:hypothetical protein